MSSSSGIRTRRGSATAYREWWQAPLRSPGRAIGTGLVALALVTLLAHVLDRPDPPPTGPPAAATSPGPAPGGAPTGPAPDQAGPAPVAPRPAPNAAAVAAAGPVIATAATDWAGRWLTHGAGPEAAAAWRRSLAPATTDEYLGLLGTVDLAAVPTGQVTGPAQVRPDPAGGSAQVDVPTSAAGLRLRLSLVEVPGRGWLVANADQAID